jgi:hypothetical protein
MDRACRRDVRLSRGTSRFDAPSPDFARRAVDSRRHTGRHRANRARSLAATVSEGRGARSWGPEATQGVSAAAPRYGSGGPQNSENHARRSPKTRPAKLSHAGGRAANRELGRLTSR